MMDNLFDIVTILLALGIIAWIIYEIDTFMKYQDENKPSSKKKEDHHD